MLARALSRDDLGQFFIGLSLAWGAALVCQWGASLLAVKWISAARSRGDFRAIRTAVWSLISFTIFQSVIVFLIILFMQKPWPVLLIWAGWTFAVSLQSLLPEILRGFDDLKWASLLSGPVPQFISLAIVALAWWQMKHLDYMEAACCVIASQFACAAVGLAVILRRAPFLFAWREALSAYREFLHESTPIALSLAFTYLLTQADLWACNYLLPIGDVAIYGIAQKFCVFVSMPMMVFGAVTTPKMAEYLASRDKNGLLHIVGRGTFLTTILSFAIFIVIAGIGWPIMRVVFGEAYTRSYPLFLVLGAGQVFHATAGPNGYLLLLSGEQRSAMRATIVAALALVVCAWWAGQYWGVLGIAVSSTLALGLQTVWMWLEVRRRLKFASHFKWIEKWSDV